MKLIVDKDEKIKKYFYVIESVESDKKYKVYHDKSEVPENVDYEEHFVEYSRPTYADFLEYSMNLFNPAENYKCSLIIVRLIRDWSITANGDTKLEISNTNFSSLVPAVGDVISYLIQKDILLDN